MDFDSPLLMNVTDGLRIIDTNGTHYLKIVCGSNLAADRALTLTTGDAARTVTLSGNLTVSADTTISDALLALKAPLASPTFTGVPVAPTAAGGTNTTQIATTAFVTAADTDVVTAVGGLLSTHAADTTSVHGITDTADLALKSLTLAQFAATTSLQLKTLISDETGSGALVFATSPTLVTPAMGTPSSGVLTNCTGLPVAGGGTGATTLTANGVVIGNGTSAVTITAEGATGKVLTGVTGGDPTWQDTITATQGTTTGSFTITAASGTWEATGISLTLPSAGTYLITGAIRGQLNLATGSNGLIAVKLVNTTDAADVTESETFICFVAGTGTLVAATGALAIPVTVDGADTIELYAKRTGGGTWTTSVISGDTNGRSRLNYLKIAP